MDLHGMHLHKYAAVFCCPDAAARIKEYGLRLKACLSHKGSAQPGDLLACYAHVHM